MVLFSPLFFREHFHPPRTVTLAEATIPDGPVVPSNDVIAIDHNNNKHFKNVNKELTKRMSRISIFEGGAVEAAPTTEKAFKVGTSTVSAN
jgi:hypothetical protein